MSQTNLFEKVTVSGELGQLQMERIELLRRSVILCCHTLRNLAFYKAGWKDGQLKRKNQFWVNANSNSLDIAVLEWCKLFADEKAKHHWKKIISNQDQFINALLQKLNITIEEFETYIKAMKTYRDKFVAHLDLERVMHPPKIRLAKKSVAFLLDYLLDNEEEEDCFFDAPKSAEQFYSYYAWLGHKTYKK